MTENNLNCYFNLFYNYKEPKDPLCKDASLKINTRVLKKDPSRKPSPIWLALISRRLNFDSNFNECKPKNIKKFNLSKTYFILI